jgi:hypothetical protein
VTVRCVGAQLTATGDALHAAMAAWTGPLVAAPSAATSSADRLLRHFDDHASVYGGGAASATAATHYGSVGRSDPSRDARLLWRVLLTLADHGGSLLPRQASALGDAGAEVADPLSASLAELLLDAGGDADTAASTGDEWVDRPEVATALALVPAQPAPTHHQGQQQQRALLRALQLSPTPTDPAALAAAGAAMEAAVAHGDRRAALAAAMAAGLWPFALLLASSLGPRAVGEAVGAFASAALPHSSPLMTAFALYAGVPPPVTRPVGDALAAMAAAATNAAAGDDDGSGSASAFVYAGAALALRHWRAHAATLVAHRRAAGNAGGNEAAYLVALGDRLWGEGASVAAAHALYLLAGVPLEPPAHGSRLVLPGYDHRRHGLGAQALRHVPSLHRGELLELGRRRANAQAPPLPALLHAKLAYAAHCADAGLLKQSAAYAVHLRAAASSAGGGVPPAFTAELEALEGRLKGCGRPLGAASAGLAGGLIEGAAATAAHAVGSALVGLKRMFLGGGGGEGSAGSGTAPASARSASKGDSVPPLPVGVGGGSRSAVPSPPTSARQSQSQQQSLAGTGDGSSPTAAGGNPPLSARGGGGSGGGDDSGGMGGGMGERRKSIVDLVSTAGGGLLSSISLRGIFTPRTGDDGKPVYRAHLPEAPKDAQPYYDEAAGRWVFPGEEASAEPPPPAAPPMALPAGMGPAIAAGGGGPAPPPTLGAPPPPGMGGGMPPLPHSAPAGAGGGGAAKRGGRTMARYVDTFNHGGAATTGGGAPPVPGAGGGGGLPPLQPGHGFGGGAAPAAAHSMVFNPAASSGGAGGPVFSTFVPRAPTPQQPS